MSDDKIIRVTDLVAPHDDFGVRVLKAVDSTGEILGEVDETFGARANRCSRSFDGERCNLDRGHVGLHSGGNDLMFTWNDNESDLVDRVPSPPPVGSFLSAAEVMEFSNKREAVPFPDYTQKQPLTPKRPWTVNIGTSGGAVIPPGVTVTVAEQMQITFRAKQIIGASQGGRLYITGVFVGQRVQMMQWSGNGMLMDFLKDRTDVDFDTATVGLNITFQVTNRGDTPGTFDLTLFGEASF